MSEIVNLRALQLERALAQIEMPDCPLSQVLNIFACCELAVPGCSAEEVYSALMYEDMRRVLRAAEDASLSGSAADR
jgi:hypothetical protein